MCANNPDHSLETSFLFLRYNGDTVEMGDFQGSICPPGLGCTTTSDGKLHYYYEANLPSENQYELYWTPSQQSGAAAHRYGSQLVVSGCPSSCRLYAQTFTDATNWLPALALPSGDNPGYGASWQGEVFNDPGDGMGPATWSSPLVHAGTWQPWNRAGVPTISTSDPNGYVPYCNASRGYNTYENYGPAQECP